MSDIHASITDLEQKIISVQQKMEDLILQNCHLTKEKEHLNNIIQKLNEEVDQHKQKYEALKLTNAILGSNDNKTEAKLKISALVREIDACITQLSNK